MAGIIMAITASGIRPISSRSTTRLMGIMARVASTVPRTQPQAAALAPPPPRFITSTAGMMKIMLARKSLVTPKMLPAPVIK